MSRNSFLIILFLAFTLSFSEGCSSVRSLFYAVKIEKVDLPLQAIQQIIVGALPAGLRKNSANSREFYSGYFVYTKSHFAPAGDAVNRYYAQVTILGDSRPYNIEILVTHEVRELSGEKFEYVRAGQDTRLAKQLEQLLRTRLTKRREDRNIIDDFRVF